MTIQLLVSVNGGSYASGAQQAAFGQSMALKAASTFEFTQIRYDIYDYPPGLTLPSGWSLDPTTNAYYYSPTNVTVTPPPVTLPSTGSNNWGRFMLRLRGNNNPLRFNPDGSPNASFNPANTDETSLVWIPSPNLGMPGVGFGETTQSDALRGYVGPIMQSLRLIDAGSGGGGGGSVIGDTNANLSLYAASTHAHDLFVATDNGSIYYSNGTSWLTILAPA
jgi:hypothetical protein